jgi:hypothetical protein
VDADESSSVTTDQTTLLPTRQKGITHSGIARSGVGWSPALKDAFDPKKAADQLRNPDHFAGPKSLLRRAHQLISDLESGILAFTQEKPWSHIVEKDSGGTGDVHKIKFTDRLSDDLPNVLFDAANNLRSVLDQAAFASARLYGKTQPTSAKFPFGRTEAFMINNARGGCKDLPPTIQTLFVSFKPFKGGNSTLWALSELANTPKHMMMVPVVIGGGGLLISSDVSGPVTFENPEWDSVNNEIVFLRIAPETKVSYNAQIAFSVTRSISETLFAANTLLLHCVSWRMRLKASY